MENGEIDFIEVIGKLEKGNVEIFNFLIFQLNSNSEIIFFRRIYFKLKNRQNTMT